MVQHRLVMSNMSLYSTSSKFLCYCSEQRWINQGSRLSGHWFSLNRHVGLVLGSLQNDKGSLTTPTAQPSGQCNTCRRHHSIGMTSSEYTSSSALRINAPEEVSEDTDGWINPWSACTYGSVRVRANRHSAQFFLLTQWACWTLLVKFFELNDFIISSCEKNIPLLSYYIGARMRPFIMSESESILFPGLVILLSDMIVCMMNKTMTKADRDMYVSKAEEMLVTKGTTTRGDSFLEHVLDPVKNQAIASLLELESSSCNVLLMDPSTRTLGFRCSTESSTRLRLESWNMKRLHSIAL